MTLGELVGALGDRRPREAIDPAALARPVTGVAYDSRRVQPGALFVAWTGQHADGAAFAADAVDRGAVAVVAERPRPAGVTVPWITVTDAREALARLAAAFFGHPAGDLQVVGITGTNGKTTTSYLVGSIFEAAGTRCGLLGTVTYRVGEREFLATRTTPEAPELHGLMRQMIDAGCGACAMEVSSHALALRRADGLRFAAGVFTNLTRDHLDFHANMEDYFAAKRRLFEMLPADAPAAPLPPAAVSKAEAPMSEVAQGLAKIEGVEGALLVAEDGVVIAHSLEGDPDKEGAVAAFVGAAAVQAGETMSLGRFKRGSVASPSGTILVLRHQDYYVGLLLAEGGSPSLVASRAETFLEGAAAA